VWVLDRQAREEGRKETKQKEGVEVMGIPSGAVATGETERLAGYRMDMTILNRIHSKMSDLMRGNRSYGQMPRFCLLGTEEYNLLVNSGLTIMGFDALDERGQPRPVEYVFGIEIVKVDRDYFLEML
jgi:hypothetical protein